MKTNVRLLGENPTIAGKANAPQTEAHGDPVDDRPRSVYEMMTRQMLDELKADVGEVKSRVNTLLWLVAGAVLLELVVRLIK